MAMRCARRLGVFAEDLLEGVAIRREMSRRGKPQTSLLTDSFPNDQCLVTSET